MAFSSSARRKAIDVSRIVTYAPTVIIAVVPPALRLKAAVRAAIEAYEKSEKMLDAALAYAAHGIPIFPVSAKTKKPVPPRDRDPITREKIAGTGGFKKATTDPVQIHKWWARHEHRIAVPTGKRIGAWVLDVDSAEDHDDGVAAWGKIAAEHDPIETREHRSATGGPHLYFNWREGIGCSKGDLPAGMSVKGEGGYVLVPPSIRKGRSYTVFKDIDPADTPQWLLERIKPNKPKRQFEGSARHSKPNIVGLEELADIVSFIPNPEIHWEEWKSMAMRIFAASGGKGFAVFQEWSQRCPEYDWKTGPAADQQCWKEVTGSPPDRTGIEKLKKMAREHGWKPGLYPHPPSYPDEGEYISPEKREQIREIVREYLDNLITPKRNPFIEWPFYSEWLARNTEACRMKIHIEYLQQQGKTVPPDLVYSWENHWKLVLDEPYVPPPIVWALNVVTGGGKTSIIIAEIADWLREHGLEFTPIIYEVTTHKLAEEVKQQFCDRGVDARVFRGYLAADPNHPANIKLLKGNPNTAKRYLKKMCRTPDRVETAIQAKQKISEAVCKQGKKVCPFYEGKNICAYRAQIPEEGDWPDVWIVASDMMFFSQEVFAEGKAVIIDETFFPKGLRGIDDDKDKEDAREKKWKVPLAELRIIPDDNNIIDVTGHSRFEFHRNDLADILQKQTDNGGVKVECLDDDLDLSWCRKAIIEEWNEIARLEKALGLYPGMPDKLFNQIDFDLIDDIKRGRHLITIWEEIKWLLLHPEVSVSGRLRLEGRRNTRAITWRGVEPVHAPFNNLPTLLADAVLPDRKILQIFYPQVVTVARINARSSPHVDIRQIVDAPTTSIKLNVEDNLLSVWHYILQEYLLIGRKDTLVICQKKVEEWLREKGLPENVFVEHYYNISGIDIYKSVALGILVGRPAPGPRQIEEIAGALLGEQQQIMPPGANGFAWYQSIDRGIRLADGKGIKVEGDIHPAKFSEAVRWPYTEGELINAHGRFRAINRTAEFPLRVRWLFDTCLPIAVDDVVKWQEPSRVVESVFEGVVPKEPADLMKIWPKRYKSLRAARWALANGVLQPPGFIQIAYQYAGTRGNKPGRVRLAYYDPKVVPDPRQWLQERLGRPLVFPGEA